MAQNLSICLSYLQAIPFSAASTIIPEAQCFPDIMLLKPSLLRGINLKQISSSAWDEAVSPVR